MRTIAKPYLLFLGDAGREFGAKTAQGVLHWTPEDCLAQFRLPGCEIDLGLPDMDFPMAQAARARTVLIGVTNRGGVLPDAWVPPLVQALAAGLDIVAGLHQRLSDVPELAQAAAAHGRALHDVRHWPGGPMPLATGRKRTGRRALMVGTDCGVGKKFTALALQRELDARGVAATFRPTGQTGALIAGHGTALDTIPGDFIAGVAEALSPDNDPDHWDVIEGQATVLHPTFAAVTTGLVHGSQPDALILCHAAGRRTMRGLPDWAVPGLAESLQAHLTCARLTNPAARSVAVSVNTKGLPDAEARAAIDRAAAETNLPTTDPVRYGAAVLADALPGS
ncbi:DUF1611 domain-containing protein [uncultured Algimonas sp.]|uniref:DUF1611 domain-containing protein n=1 Tax=uncultured Algimonas sp. TaxID=1547920 RepID=UPI002625409E|nr:DUF1611 domain-containing protein [uncultured Algimonas sp.]